MTTAGPESKPPKPADGVDSLYRSQDAPPGPEGLIYLDRNERLSPPPQWFLDKVKAALTGEVLTGYPNTHDLRRKLADHHGVKAERVLLAAGSDGVFKSVFQAYSRPGDRVVSLSPSYAMYEVYSKMFQAEFAPVEFGDGLTLDAERLISAVTRGASLVLIANPNQPTGTALDRETLERVAARAAETGALVVFDEAYFHFHGHTMMDLTGEYRNVVVARTFSKAAGLAGLRLGYAVGDEEVILNLHRVRQAYDINSVAALAASILLDHPEIIDDYVKEVGEGRRVLEEGARGLGLRPLPTHANFVLVDTGEYAPGDVVLNMKKHGFAIKGPFESQALSNCVRITLGPAPIMEKCVKALALSLNRVGSGVGEVKT